MTRTELADKLLADYAQARETRRALCLYGESVREIATALRSADERIATLEARLEIDHAFKLVNDEMGRFEIPPTEDGISCLDETIKLLEALREEANADDDDRPSP